MSTTGTFAAGTSLFFGRYRVEGLLAEGGMGSIYRGIITSSGEPVAIKALCFGSDPDDEAALRKEYALLATIHHENIARSLDFFVEGGQPCLVEEFVSGETLEKRVRTAGRLTWEQAQPIVEQVLQALQFLNDRFVIYRDLKPSNVMLQPDGKVKLIDFGAARLLFRSSSGGVGTKTLPPPNGATAGALKTGPRHDTVAMGTPGYASPEHFYGQTDARSDVYTAGVMLHEMLTGLEPTMSQAWVFKPPRDLRPDVPEYVSDAVMRAVRIKPDERFQTAAEMLRVLGRVLEIAPEGRTLQFGGPSSICGHGVCLVGVGLIWGAEGMFAWAALAIPLGLLVFGAGLCVERRYTSLCVHFNPSGLHVVWTAKDLDIEVLWNDVAQIILRGHRRITSKVTSIHLVLRTPPHEIIFPQDWEGNDALLEELLRHMHLRQRSRPKVSIWTGAYTEIYEL